MSRGLSISWRDAVHVEVHERPLEVGEDSADEHRQHLRPVPGGRERVVVRLDVVQRGVGVAAFRGGKPPAVAAAPVAARRIVPSAAFAPETASAV